MIDAIWEILDSMAEECGGYPIAIGLSFLLWILIAFALRF